MSDASLRLEDQLCFALYTATNAVVRTYRPMLEGEGLTYPQYLVLLVLWQQGTQPVGAIAQTLHLGASAITPLVDRLCARGLVRRNADPVDRRVVMAELTEAGEALQHRVADLRAQVVCRIGLSELEFADLRARLHQLLDRMGAAGALAEASPAA